MANREKGYGMTKEINDRILGKYSKEDESIIVQWIASIVKSSPSEEGIEAFHAWLKDGQVLCALMNGLQDRSINKVHDLSKVKLAAMKKNKEMENISFFLGAAEKYGVGRGDLFQTVDLYENQNMAQVQTTIIKLTGVALKKGFKSDVKIGVKESDKNKRDFDEQKLREGRNVIGLQMGTNQLASQSGQTAYGLGRQVAPSNK